MLFVRVMVVRLGGVANHPIIATLVNSVIGFGSLRLGVPFIFIYSYIGGH
jgi:hypothetical protein